jgi:hypothetical protein
VPAFDCQQLYDKLNTWLRNLPGPARPPGAGKHPPGRKRRYPLVARAPHGERRAEL